MEGWLWRRVVEWSHDPEVDAALFEAIESTLKTTANRRLVRLPLPINEPAFAQALVDNFHEIAR